MEYSIALMEVRSLVAAIEGVDAMLKAADVELIATERRLGGRLVTVIVRGSVSAVTVALEAGIEAANKVGKVVASDVIARPHLEILKFFDI
jgi:ethanolamine utilization protein EutM